MRATSRALVGPLRRAIAIRLAALFGLLVPVVGGVVVATHVSRLEDFIESLAIHDAEAYAHEHPEVITRGLLAANPHTVSRALTRFLAAGTGSRMGEFVSGRVYGADGTLIAAAQIPDPRVPPDLTDGAAVPPGLGLGALVGTAPAVLRVRFAVTDEDGRPLGAYEGVFRVSDDAVSAIRHGVLLTLGAVVLVLGLGVLAFYPVIMDLTRRLLWRGQRLLHANTDALEILGSALAKRDAGTEEHGQRVTLYALRLGEAAGLPHDAMRRLAKGALLHDIGKIAIPDAVLLKPGPLSEDEVAVMRGHVHHGLDIVNRSAWLAEARDVVGGHHEWFDGSGYPAGAAGTAIPVTARVFAIADVFDALTTRRPYKAAMPLDEALGLLRAGAGSHFDPALVDRFAAIAPALHDTIQRMRPEAVQDDLRGLLDRYLAPSDGGV
ncbi:HD-GYP domain-containing protein [Novispirillum sp. DQ9]|uniref:HD-GYP domain-containing protein n=1 Tax=Novispirillum sp. DQ9 TaxID=3398612 RepID=UPI003C7EAFB6